VLLERGLGQRWAKAPRIIPADLAHLSAGGGVGLLAYEANMDKRNENTTETAAPAEATTSATPPKAKKQRRRGLPKGVIAHGDKFRIRWFDHAGRRQSEVFATVKQAERGLRERLNNVNDIRAGLRRALPEKSFDDLFDYWLEKRVQQKRSGADDTSIIKKHLRPSFGGLRLRDFTAEHVDDFREERDDLSDKTVHNHLTLLRTMLGVARDELQWIASFAKFKKPKLRVFETDFRYLRNDEEVARFLAAARAEGPLAFALYATAIYTGMRAGELGGLRRGDIDFEKKLIVVQRSVDGLTKSGDVRYVPLLAPLAPVLRQWLLQNPSEQVFFNRDGGDLRPSGRIYQEVLHRVLDAAKFPSTTRSSGTVKRYIRFHDLRHTFASHWVMKGGDLFRLQKILGHASPVMTQRYAHLAPTAFAGDHDRLGGADSLTGGVVLHLRARK